MESTPLTAELQTRRSEIVAQMASLVADAAAATTGGISFGKRVGDGTIAAVQRMTEVNLHNGLRTELGLVDAALAKIEAGTYGDCEVCGNPISPARLEALPWAIWCVDCS